MQEVKKSAKGANARGRRKSHAARLTTKQLVPPAKSSPIKRERGDSARERVLLAALECFGTFGFEGTSTRAVADRAGLSHPLLLYHFESKDKLWSSTMEHVVGRYRGSLYERLARQAPDDAAAGLDVFIDHFVTFSASTPQLHRILTQESTQGSERIHWLLNTHLRESFENVCRLIVQAQAMGRVRAGDPARLYYAVIGLAGTLLSVSTEFRLVTGRDVFKRKELRETIDMIHRFLFI
ncbi:MAG: TetR family transcriptional regulator [Gammaproteobacteria bacterium]|nr:TetR family transcriptional regulator [Gammaproteobacteria bacterium]